MATFELTKEFLEKIEQALEDKDDAFLVDSLDGLYSADVAEILYELDGPEAHNYFLYLDDEKGAEVLSSIDSDDRKRFIKENFTVEEISKYLNFFESDDAVDLLNEQTIEVREKVIASLEDRQKARYIIDLLHYPEDVAGGLMQKELVKVYEDQTVSECVEAIREQAESVEKVYAVYVVDEEQRLTGIVSMKQIVLAHRNTKISNIKKEDIISVDTTKAGEDVAEVMQRYDLEAVPVVNTLGRLLGRITIDDVVDFITEKAEEDFQAMSGLTGEAEEDDTVWVLAKSRLPWLIVGVFGSLAAASVIKGFEDQILRISALAIFIPIMGSTGGNVGIQTSSLIVQSLAERSGLSLGLKERLSKVLQVALLNGVVIGILAGLYVYLIGESSLFWVVSAALLSVVFISSFMGTITPLLLDRLGINPAVASGPFITTANDLIGISVYFGIAYLLL